MTDFRRWITVLAVMALFVGLASAQVGGGSTSGTANAPFTCSVENVTVTPNLRSEGYAEMTGDIVLVCTGGSPLATGTTIPTVNITVYYPGTVTSRLLSTSTGVNASEAILLIDEPNNNALGSQYGYGPSLPQIICSTPQYGAGSNGCAQVVGNNTGAAYNLGSGVSTVGAWGVPIVAGGTTPGANVFQGAVSGQAVTFYGVPVLPRSPAASLAYTASPTFASTRTVWAAALRVASLRSALRSRSAARLRCRLPTRPRSSATSARAWAPRFPTRLLSRSATQLRLSPPT